MKLNGLFSHSCFHRINFHVLIPDRGGSVFHSFQTFQSGPLLCTSGPAASFRPFLLDTQDTLAFSFGSQLHLLPFRLHFQKTGIFRLIAINLPVADLQNFVCNTVQKIAVVRDHDHCSLKTVQIIFQPFGHFIVQMIGRLVQDKNIRRVYQHGGKGGSFFLSS